MAKRVEAVRKRTTDVVSDLLTGHRQAGFDGPQAARKYLERVLSGQQSLANAAKFFAYDLLCDACAQTDAPERAWEAVEMARQYVEIAQEESPKEWKDYFAQIRLYEVGVALCADDGRFEIALELCEEAIALGLGRHYEQKAASLRRMI